MGVMRPAAAVLVLAPIAADTRALYPAACAKGDQTACAMAKRPGGAAEPAVVDSIP
jgi:hypothetical protein